MSINEILDNIGMTKYRLAKLAGIPHATLSEHIASSIFNMVGINTQETLLGTFNASGKEKIVSACKDFSERACR